MSLATTDFSEATWEGLVLDHLGELDWKPTRGDEIAPRTGDVIGKGVLAKIAREPV